MRALPLLLLVIASCTRPDKAQTAAYADPRLCAACHQQIAKTYAKTGMARAFQKASIDNTGPASTFVHPPSNRNYKLLQKDGAFYLRRSQQGFQNQEANVLELRIDYVMGSGNHARTFLHRTPQNRLLQLPVGWYAEQGGRLEMSPGYDTPNHPDFRRLISHDCMFCHNAYPQLPANADRAGADPIFPATLPEGIDCQRCHGPAQAHVEAAQQQQPAAVIRAGVLNPKRLPTNRQLEVCMQCHLETTSTPLPNSIVRYDRGHYSYRPSEPLAGFQLHFDHADRPNKFEIVNSAYRLRQSACFQKSQDKLTCTTCHNPHDVPRGEAAVTHYNNTCQQCHQQPPHPGNCIGCHMPKRSTDDVVHAAMTDHKITRKPEPRNPVTPPTYQGEVVLYYPTTLPAGADRDLYLAAAQVVQHANDEKGIPRLAAALQQHKPTGPAFYFQLAQAYAGRNQHERAIPFYEQALRQDAGFVPALRNLGAAQAALGQADKARETLEKAVAANSNDPNAWHELARAREQSGRVQQALAAARQAVQLQPEFPEAHNTLAAILREAGKEDEAISEYEEAIRWQPDYAEAHSNLAGLLAQQQNLAKAEYHFQQAIRHNPQLLAARFNYAAALAANRRYPAAEQQIQVALRIEPANPAANELAGNLAAVRQNWQKAITHYRTALASNQNFAPAQLGLGTALAATGDPQGARQYLQKATTNPSTREAATELLRLLSPQ